MKTIPRIRFAPAIALCIVAASISSCAVGPGMDGGIVGTGNRVDCDAKMKKDGTPAPLPEVCQRENEVRR